jgi:hypothetical protein
MEFRPTGSVGIVHMYDPVVDEDSFGGVPRLKERVWFESDLGRNAVASAMTIKVIRGS